MIWGNDELLDVQKNLVWQIYIMQAAANHTTQI